MTIKSDLDKLGLTEAVKKLLANDFCVGKVNGGWLSPSDLADDPAEAAWRELVANYPDGVPVDDNPLFHRTVAKTSFLAGFKAGREWFACFSR